MVKLFQVNVAANWGSHGRIAEEIGNLVQEKGWESCIAYGRYANHSRSKLLRIGNPWNVFIHGVKSLFLDNHGLNSVGATKRLIYNIEQYSPSLIHLHNIHGYYLNYPLLFDYLAGCGVPVVWTLHDCWPFTGHCSHPIYAHCEKWVMGCRHCAALSSYPRSLFFDRSESNYMTKKDYFNRVNNLTIVSVSRWLDEMVEHSFLNNHRHVFIYNGVDCDIFNPQFHMRKQDEFLVLGVANVWYAQKGLNVFFEIRKMLPENYHILLVGLSNRQIRNLPKGIEGIHRTDNVTQLVDLYSRADVFVNPSLAETFGLTTVEALSCGTPAVVYNTSACPELVTEDTGRVVPLDNISAMAEAIIQLCNNNNQTDMRISCRERAVKYFNKNDRYQEYLDLYNSLLKH